MPNWSESDLNAYERRQNCARGISNSRPINNRCAPSSPVVEQAVRHASLEPMQRKTLYTGRVLVWIKSYRRRLCDEDGLVGKYFLDAIRYSNLVRDDSPAHVSYKISQEKVAKKEEERTEITIEPL